LLWAYVVAIYPILTIDKNKFRFPKWVGAVGKKAFLQIGFAVAISRRA
jgi:hypothetical protein